MDRRGYREDFQMARSREELKEIYDRNWDLVYRICLIYMRNRDDALDMVQETFLKLMQKDIVFNDENHESAWLRVVACNLCKNELGHWWKQKRVMSEDWEKLYESKKQADEHRELMEALFNIPEKFRILLYLHYYEGYSIEEIGKIFHQNPSTLRSRLGKARILLEEKLKEELP